MAAISSYKLELEPEQKHVFVTQLRDEEDDHSQDADAKKVPVIKEEKGRLLETGRNTLQRTLLLKREAKINEVQFELDKKKNDFEERMEKCKWKKEELKKRQKTIRDRIQRFEKFVKENDAKRKRAMVKYQQEMKVRDSKTKELEQVQTELAAVLLRHQTLKQRLAKYFIFEKYLTMVLDSLPEGYLESTDNMLAALMMRFRTLSTTNNLLVERLAKCSDEVENGQKTLQDMNENHTQSLLVFNSELAAIQKELEVLRERNMKLEQTYTSRRLSFRQQTENLGQIMIAIDNIAEKCRSSHETEDLDQFEKLDLIKEYLAEKEDIYVSAKSNVPIHVSGLNDRGKTVEKSKTKGRK